VLFRSHRHSFPAIPQKESPKGGGAYTRSAPKQTQRKQTVIMGFDDLNQWYSGLVDSDTGYFLRANEQQRNPGGNIECSPALPSYPYGRLIVGANLAAPAREFFQAQKLQTDNGNLIELPVSWLHIKHVDEVMTMIPVGSGFKVLVADLQMAIDLLRSNPTNETWGGFSTRAEILAAYDANSNRVAEICNHLAAVRSALAQGLGVNESTFIKVPVAFTLDTDEYVETYLPNMINMIVVKPASGAPKLVPPRPFFVPYVLSFESSINNAGFEGSGEFVDTSGPHSDGGEAHCASNVRREAP